MIFPVYIEKGDSIGLVKIGHCLHELLDLLVAKSQCCDNLITALERLGKQHNFSLTRGMFDRLLKPINQIILLFEDIFFTNFSTYTKNLSVGGDILKLLKKMSVPFKCCNDFPLDFLQNLSLRFCIPHSLKFANHDLSSSKRKTKSSPAENNSKLIA